jgi:hypothetical protein
MQISEAAEQEGFAADNISYGMGGGLLQRVNRDTMSFATKLSHIVYDGTHVAVRSCYVAHDTVLFMVMVVPVRSCYVVLHAPQPDGYTRTIIMICIGLGHMECRARLEARQLAVHCNTPVMFTEMRLMLLYTGSADIFSASECARTSTYGHKCACTNTRPLYTHAQAYLQA